MDSAKLRETIVGMRDAYLQELTDVELHKLRVQGAVATLNDLLGVIADEEKNSDGSDAG